MASKVKNRVLITMPMTTVDWAQKKAMAEHRPLSNCLAHIIEQCRADEEEILVNLTTASAFMDNEEADNGPECTRFCTCLCHE